jgi:hypothetical protein
MNRVQALLNTPRVCIRRFNHPAAYTHRDPPEEEAHEYSINLVERGSFDLQIAGRSWTLVPGMVFRVDPC